MRWPGAVACRRLPARGHAGAGEWPRRTVSGSRFPGAGRDVGARRYGSTALSNVMLRGGGLGAKTGLLVYADGDVPGLLR
jgi:hypothetical protein